jgi:membrane fusion protein (multidrug efflux system)
MLKRILVTLFILAVVIGVPGGVKFLQISHLIAQGNPPAPVEAVTTAPVVSEEWQPTIGVVGSLVAVQGVTVSAELDGKIAKIAFESGSAVKAGDLLVSQDITGAQADNIRSVIAKKTIKAPFDGRLGIRLVNLGQTLKAGDAIVSLQALEPIYANFQLPQQDLNRIGVGFHVQVTGDAVPGKAIAGTITAINPDVDSATRNVRVQATLENGDEQLRPGMFVNVAVLLPAKEQVLAIPASAVLYAPYGDSVFIVDEGKDGKGAKTVRQQFVRLGRRRGDFVAVVSGLKASDTVVSTGVFKLRNGGGITVDNSLAPNAKLAPKTSDS